MEPNQTNTDTNKPEFINLNVHKAGLDGLDKERIDQIIQEASKGSNFYTFQQRREKRINEQIRKLKQRSESITDIQREQAMKKADSIIVRLEQNRILNKIIVHFDMDMFYAAVEIKNDPSLADIPMAVGSMAMISTSNYVARRFGVRSAMAGFIAKKLCPQLKLIRPNFRNYMKESEFVMNIINQYDPNMRTFSLDEVYIDLTDYVFENFSDKNKIPLEDLYAMNELSDEIWQYAYEIVEEIRSKVYEESKLTISAGISCNTLLAKVCTDINKPNGQFMIKGKRETIMDFVSQIPIRKFCGIGPVKDHILSAFNINKAIDIYNERALLACLFNDIDYYLRIYLGIGSTHLSNEESTQQKSHSRERTVGELSNFDQICDLIKEISNRLSKDLKKEQQLCKTITLKMKKVTFDTFIKCKTIDHYTDDENVLFNVAKELLTQEMEKSPQNKYRLIGLRASNLCNSNEINDNTSNNNQSTLLKFLKRKSSEFENEQNLVDSELEPNIENNNNYDDDNDIYMFDNVDELSLYHQNEDNANLNLCSNQEIETKSNSDENNNENESNITIVDDDNNTNKNNNDSNNNDNNNNNNEEAKFLKCPICQLNSLFNTNDDLNRHIDICLNRQLCIELTSIVADDQQKFSSSKNNNNNSENNIDSFKLSSSSSSSTSSTTTPQRQKKLKKNSRSSEKHKNHDSSKKSKSKSITSTDIHHHHHYQTRIEQYYERNQ